MIHPIDPNLADAEERTRIRTDLDTTFMVEAAAGTGKTTELVERMIAVLSSGRSTVDSLVGVTFTEKAAGELRLRLRAGLEEARHGLEPGNEVRRNLENALARLEEARLSTIHGFCADTLRERSIEAAVDPQFQTVTDVESIRIFRESFDSWLQSKLEDPPEGVRRSLRRSSGPRRGGNVGLVRRHDDDGPLQRLREAAWTLLDWRDFRTRWSRPRDFDRVEQIDRFIGRLHEFASLTATASDKERDTLYLDTERVRQLSEQIAAAEAVRDRDHDGLEALLVDLPWDRTIWKRKGRTKKYGESVLRADVLEARDRLKADLEQFRTEVNADLAACLQGEIFEAVDRYEELKIRTGKVDFLDLLIQTRDLVRDDATVRREYQERFSHIFVDEFQDTDPLQTEILLLLSADDPEVDDWTQVKPAQGKLFLVGDPKQSIYRFRRADVGIYQDVKEMLLERDAQVLQLTTSFRSVPAIQRVINSAFAPLMKQDRGILQADYVPLTPKRPDFEDQPSVVALPVPKPYGAYDRITHGAIEGSLPKAVGAFVEWLIKGSGWTVVDPEQDGRRVPIQPRHVCLLFRRFHGFYVGDVTRGYIQELEGRGIRHLLVGGRSFHEREEVETIRTALCAVEWPDDELSIFATLRGSLFGIGDEELLEYRHEHRRLHPYRIPEELPERLESVRDALVILKKLHLHRNTRPIAETVTSLLEATRAHAGFALRPSGEQALANVLHIAEHARLYESTGGISFRGFVDQLVEEAEEGRAAEAPILEDGSDGVRVMTVHKAKGLEFPIVILADITTGLGSKTASRYIDPHKDLCAVRVGGWSPVELLEYERVEVERDRAEGVRLAYVAATRARDLLVVPALREGPERITSFSDDSPDAGWVAPLSTVLYPDRSSWSHPDEAPGCPKFAGEERVDVPFEIQGKIHAGLHVMSGCEAVWWGLDALELEVERVLGMRRTDLLEKGVDPALVETDRNAFETWAEARRVAVASGSVPTRLMETATARSLALTVEGAESADDTGAAENPFREMADTVTIERAEVNDDRPGGKRFGSLVHAVLAVVSLDEGAAEIAKVSRLQGRILGASEEEIEASVEAVSRALAHPILERASRSTDCRRETPVVLRVEDGTLIDGIVDLAFLEADRWVVVDFKTDRDLGDSLDAYRTQVAIYAEAIRAATGQEASGVLLQI